VEIWKAELAFVGRETFENDYSRTPLLEVIRELFEKSSVTNKITSIMSL
jgi:hypothetical protein